MSPEPVARGAGGGLNGRSTTVDPASDGAPWLLDLFCGAGGAAMGYSRAGWNVVGVDLARQPRYPFAFVQADALAVLDEGGASGFAAIHASPPCQAFVKGFAAINAKLGRGKEHPNLIPPTRERLQETGLPYIIENVPGAPLLEPVRVCGVSLGLDVRRHRLFESNVGLMVPPCACGRWREPKFVGADHAGRTEGRLARVVALHGGARYRGDFDQRRRAAAIDWMTLAELAQAIPPAYTELLGAQLLAYADEGRRAAWA